MGGHSNWANVKHKRSAIDKKLGAAAAFLLLLLAVAGLAPATRPAVEMNHPASLAYSDFLLLALEDAKAAGEIVVIEGWADLPPERLNGLTPAEAEGRHAAEIGLAVATSTAGHARLWHVIGHRFGDEPTADVAEAVRSVRGMNPVRVVRRDGREVAELLYAPEGAVQARLARDGEGGWRPVFTLDEVYRRFVQTADPPPTVAQLFLTVGGYGGAAWQAAAMTERGHFEDEDGATEYYYNLTERVDEALGLTATAARGWTRTRTSTGDAVASGPPASATLPA